MNLTLTVTSTSPRYLSIILCSRRHTRGHVDIDICGSLNSHISHSTSKVKVKLKFVLYLHGFRAARDGQNLYGHRSRVKQSLLLAHWPRLEFDVFDDKAVVGYGRQRGYLYPFLIRFVYGL